MKLYYHDPDITVETIEQGEDLLIRIFGGKAHIGSVAVAEPRPSLTGEGTSSTVSVINYCGHKDDAISVPVASKVCAAIGKHTVVVCGIHFDNIPSDLLKKISNLPEKIVEDILSR